MAMYLCVTSSDPDAAVIIVRVSHMDTHYSIYDSYWQKGISSEDRKKKQRRKRKQKRKRKGLSPTLSAVAQSNLLASSQLTSA